MYFWIFDQTHVSNYRKNLLLHHVVDNKTDMPSIYLNHVKHLYEDILDSKTYKPIEHAFKCNRAIFQRRFVIKNFILRMTRLSFEGLVVYVLSDSEQWNVLQRTYLLLNLNLKGELISGAL